MAFSSDNFKVAFHAAVADPCEKCQFTTCYSLNSSNMLICPYTLCPDCLDLQILDAQITDDHDLLATLSQKRYTIKGRINHRHDPLTSRLPLEIITMIFNLVVSMPRPPKFDDSYSWNPVVVIGAVCKRWRDITLGTPQLWTPVVLNPLKHSSSLEIAQQWLSRSFPLPLSLSVDAKEEPSELPPDTSDLLELLRSHASRWNDLSLGISMEMLLDLLDGLEGRAPVDSLTIFIDPEFRSEIEDITMECPFVPKSISIFFTPISLLPARWDRLTHMRAHDIAVDEALYVVRESPNLQDCHFEFHPLSGEVTEYPIPASPSINGSVTCLNTQLSDRSSGPTQLLQHLTLPSLETFSYALTHTDCDREELDTLIAFLDRSHPPLREFSFWPDDSTLRDVDWYYGLSSITTLDISLSSNNDEEMLQAYIQGLKADLVPLALPRLQQLTIGASWINPRTCDALVDIFPNNHREHDTDNDAVAPVVSRPLETVTLSIRWAWENQEIMRESTLNRLRIIRESGVKLAMVDKKQTDLLDPLLQMDHFTCFESDDEYDD